MALRDTAIRSGSRVDGLTERVGGEIAIEALDGRLDRHRGDAVDRREEPGPEVRGVRHESVVIINGAWPEAGLRGGLGLVG